MRLFGSFLHAALSVAGVAQIPDLTPIVDLRASLVTTNSGPRVIRWYDPLARYSTVGFRLLLESGLSLHVAERLQRIPGDADSEQLDEAYVEDPGQWKIGRQYMPFGAQNLIRECVLGAKINGQLLVANLPFSVAVCEGGTGRTRGAIGRIGNRLGVSFAVGNHFGASATSLVTLRSNPASAGRGRGYRTLLGLDYKQNLGLFDAYLEVVRLDDPDRPTDTTNTVSDVKLTTACAKRSVLVEFGWSRGWRESKDVIRIAGEWKVDSRLSIMPFVNFSDRRWQSLALTTRIKL